MDEHSITKRHIGRGDIEFYASKMVIQVSRSLTSRDFDSLSYRSRQRLLNKAVDIVSTLLNDETNQRFMRDFTLLNK